MRAGLLLPGQGFQKLGLLKFAAQAPPKVLSSLLDQVDEALPNLRLSAALTGDNYQYDITATEIAQPLILAATWANYEICKPYRDQLIYAMGHSMGEYSAFVVAGLLPIRDALILVHARGEAMRDAAKQFEETGMSLFVRPSKVDTREFGSKLSELCSEYNLDIANINSSTQTTLSGRKIDLNAAASSIKDTFGRVIVKPLNVSGAFHSRYMKPAQPRLAELVSKAKWNFQSDVKVISNQTARPYGSLDEIKGACVSALVEPVKWLDSVRFVSQDVDKLVSLGPGKIGKFTEKDTGIPTEYLEPANQ